MPPSNKKNEDDWKMLGADVMVDFDCEFEHLCGYFHGKVIEPGPNHIPVRCVILQR
jgi:hypothetical protein